MAGREFLAIETTLRELIAREGLDDARRLLDDYAAAVENELQLHKLDPAVLLEVSSHVSAFFGWAEARTKAHRSYAESESSRLRSVVAYDSAPDVDCHSETA